MAVMSDAGCKVGCWVDAKITAVRRGRVKESQRSDRQPSHEMLRSWGHGVKAAAREVCLLEGKI